MQTYLRSLKIARSSLITSVAGVLLSGLAVAEEGGSGHYLPGAMASFIDGVPPKETFATRLNVVTYNATANRNIPLGGAAVANADVSSTGVALSFAWRPAMDLPAGWSYGASATIPMVTLDVSGSLAIGPLSRGISDSVSAIGDIVLQPLMLNYSVNPDFNTNFRISAYLPTGSYQVGRLANAGKNFLTIEPTLGFLYFGQKNGREAALYIGADFNQENRDTNYKSGTQFHLDGVLAQHFPLAGGLAGAGINAFYYEQVSGDSGTGATFGEFRAKTVGIGPALSFVTKIGGHDLVSEFKWLHEIETDNRLKGDTIWLKVLYKFY